MTSLLRSKYPFISPSISVDHLVVGAGVVGLAIAEKLAQSYAHKTTFLVERHGQAGRETSSRNSEVIHNGLMYPLGSLKSLLCLRGREKLYTRCSKKGISFRQVGKLILANTKVQEEHIKGLVERGKEIKRRGEGEVPLVWMTGEEIREIEPDIGQGVKSGLFSERTGIVDSHALMEDLEKGIEDSGQGELVYGTKVVRVDRVEGKAGSKRGDGVEDGWVVQTVTKDGKGEWGVPSSVLAKVVINAAGLNAHHLLNHIFPPTERTQLYYAAGNYFSYRGPGCSNVKRLLYPSPDSSAYAGLGTHLTLNLAGEIRFGPDVDWLEAPMYKVDEIMEDEPDFWEHHLAAKDTRLTEAIEEVKKYLPNVDAAGFTPDYVGIRPKRTAKGAPPADFSIAHPLPGFISLLGIESPGLTSSLAIGDYVEKMVREQVHGLGRGKGDVISEAGGLDLNAWA